MQLWFSLIFILFIPLRLLILFQQYFIKPSRHFKGLLKALAAFILILLIIAQSNITSSYCFCRMTFGSWVPAQFFLYNNLYYFYKFNSQTRSFETCLVACCFPTFPMSLLFPYLLASLYLSIINPFPVHGDVFLCIQSTGMNIFTLLKRLHNLNTLIFITAKFKSRSSF